MEAVERILVLCTGNSCRSQMAEGYLREFAGDRFEIHSAGMEPAPEVNPLAVAVMREEGIDLSGQSPKSVSLYLGRMSFRHVVVVCDRANRDCPHIFPGAVNRLYWPFDDPAAFQGDPESTIEEFRRIRDQIRERIIEWLKESQSRVGRPVNNPSS